jgi:hypothetical protein
VWGRYLEGKVEEERACGGMLPDDSLSSLSEEMRRVLPLRLTSNLQLAARRATKYEKIERKRKEESN